MHEKFDDVNRAVSYVASGVRADFASRGFEVLVERRGAETAFTCTTAQITRVLLDACRRFPMATVYYTAEDPAGHVAEIHCHCRGEKSPSCCRYNHPRARVMVHLAPAEAQEPKESGGALSGV